MEKPVLVIEQPRNPNWRGRLSTIDLLIKIVRVVKKYSFNMKKAANMN